ncbi:endo-1,4-beta-xylanase 1-like isoform X3 [Phoenix dactylifera]|uniref:Endo-1,4-beta-xylanase 1-like isoform X3 n=1 Tax=Phoenix dactylifera TaxID=42345 RepID=A0A8B7MU60_PHODC|nr:endo-1,4-beta-xylanase 1-like isoform X3 [Phoenix dactylifera]
MRRWLSGFCLSGPKRRSVRTHDRPDPTETRGGSMVEPQGSNSTADPQSSSRISNGSQRMEMVVDLQASQQKNIILNHEFSEGLNYWHPNCCHGYVASEECGLLDGVRANSGGNYAVVTQRTESWQGLEQDITGKITLGVRYNVSAYVRAYGDLQEPCGVQATLKLENQDSSINYLLVERVLVAKDRWEKLEGSFSLTSMPKHAVFYLEGPPPGVDLLIDSVTVSCEEKSPRCVTNGDETISWNPHFDTGIHNWSGRGCKIHRHEFGGDGNIRPFSGNFFVSATERTQSWNGIQQEITGRVQRKLAYEVTSVVRISGSASSADVRATLWVQAPNGREQYIGIAKLQASDKEWVQLQGKFLLNGAASKAIIFLEGPPPGTDILVDSFVVKHAAEVRSSPPPHFENILYGVNIIKNSTLNDGLNGWSPLGSCTLRVSTDPYYLFPSIASNSLGHDQPLGNCYILTVNRTETWMGPSQTITGKLKLHLTYRVAAWVRVGSGATGPQNVNVALAVDNQWINGGQVEANTDRWYELKGSFRIEKQPSKVVVYVQGPSPGVDLMVGGLQIFPVDRKARVKYLKEKTEKVRKRDVVLKLPGFDSASLHGAPIKIRQTQNSFPFGSCINRSNIENEEFVDFFVKNFNWAVFGNELKWYHTEPQQGKLNYKDADEMLDFCQRHGKETRGHCIFWEVEDAVQPWVRSLNSHELMIAIQKRLKSLLSRYKGKFRHYDVNNEMLHGSFYQDKLGEDIRAYMFRESHQLDPSAILFVNDYNVEDGCDPKSTPEMYIHQILDLQERGAPVGGIGIQAHISHPVGEIICDALDKLAILGLPIWFTELDVSAVNEHVRADDLEVVLREAYAHPAVEGVMLWGFWELFTFRDNSHLVDAEGSINEAGKRYLALKQEWLSHTDGHINAYGEFKFRGYHGTYTVEITTPPGKKISQSFVVDSGDSPLVLIVNL